MWLKVIFYCKSDDFYTLFHKLVNKRNCLCTFPQIVCTCLKNYLSVR
ncbi:hypothetical protein HMPREF1573_00933 [Gardnerella vaginalis JCP7276]|nr:hypothetical protein HMPREF1573_00933 [Gardnerella vaginalis JCP7276]